MKIPFKNKNKTKAHAAEKVSILFLMLILIITCEKTNDLPKYTPPADHTISKDGFLHKSGLDQPLTVIGGYLNGTPLRIFRSSAYGIHIISINPGDTSPPRGYIK